MKFINLSGGFSHLFCIVDDEDYEELIKYRWFNTRGYACANKNYKQIQMHRYILSIYKEIDNFVCDHINGNRLDNRKENLRLVNKRENSYNKSKKKGKIGFKNVRKDKNKFSAYITFNRKWIHIGNFDTDREAAIAYDIKAKEFFGEMAKLNLPEASLEETSNVLSKILNPKKVSGTSKFRGVSKKRNKWIAQCGGACSLAFNNEEEAAKAYDQMAKEKYGSNAILNFV